MVFSIFHVFSLYSYAISVKNMMIPSLQHRHPKKNHLRSGIWEKSLIVLTHSLAHFLVHKPLFPFSSLKALKFFPIIHTFNSPLLNCINSGYILQYIISEDLIHLMAPYSSRSNPSHSLHQNY